MRCGGPFGCSIDVCANRPIITFLFSFHFVNCHHTDTLRPRARQDSRPKRLPRPLSYWLRVSSFTTSVMFPFRLLIICPGSASLKVGLPLRSLSSNCLIRRLFVFARRQQAFYLFYVQGFIPTLEIAGFFWRGGGNTQEGL